MTHSPPAESPPRSIRRRLFSPGTGPFTTARGLLPLLLVCGFLFAYPIAMLVVGAFRNADPSLPAQWGTQGFDSYTDSSTYETLKNSVLLATSVTVLATAAGLLCAFLVTRTNTPLRRIVTPIMVLIVALPPLFYAISWGMFGNARIGLLNSTFRDITGSEGTLFDVNSWPGLIVVIALKAAAFSYLMLLGPFMALDRNLEEASQISGAGRLKTLLRIDLPVLAPALSGVVILNFVIGLEFFEVPLFLGVPAGINVFSTQIYGLIKDQTPADYGGASALSLLLIVVVMLLVALQWRLLGNRQFTTVTGKSYRQDRWDIGAWKWAGTAFIAGYVLLALVLPLAQLVLGSLQPFFGSGTDYSLIHYENVLSDPETVTALRSTLTVSVVGGLIAMLLALLIAYAVAHSKSRWRRAIEMLTWLPWAVPGVVLSLAVAWAYVSAPVLRELYATIWIVMIGLVVAAIPIASRAAQAAVGQLGRELEEASRISGARPLRTVLRIVLPLIAPSFLTGWFVVAIVISGNLAVPILLTSQGNVTVPVVIFERYTSGATGEAAALFVIVLGVLSTGLGALALLAQLLKRYQSRGGAGGDSGSGADSESGNGPDSDSSPNHPEAPGTTPWSRGAAPHLSQRSPDEDHPSHHEQALGHGRGHRTAAGRLRGN